MVDRKLSFDVNGARGLSSLEKDQMRDAWNAALTAGVKEGAQ